MSLKCRCCIDHKNNNNNDEEQKMSFTILEYDKKAPGFLVESIVPDNVETPDQTNEPEAGTKRVDISRIVDHLTQTKSPNLVISVHGFNSPRKDAIRRFSKEFSAVDADTAITSDTVCIGYRWPSEAMGSPWKTIWLAAPYFLRWMTKLGVVFLVFFMLFDALSNVLSILAANPVLKSITFALALVLLAISVTFFLLRVIVYFRDGYRANQYGVPELVDLVRKIDEAMYQRQKSSDNNVGLSFIGHSMGAYVVTNAVRILSNVFSKASLTQDSSDPEIRKIGRKFHLQNLVLVSPDIPAEALMPNTSNFLNSSLRRFEEAYLFSNEGDEVLRLISVSANYFSFPTARREFGYRLGNVGVLTSDYGVTARKNWSLKDLRIGFKSVENLSEDLHSCDSINHPAYAFGYFDCTDCIDPESGLGILTTAKRGVPFNKSWHSHLLLLCRYLLPNKNSLKRDVHSAYFDSDEIAGLIYRLASIGYSATDTASGGVNNLCEKVQVKVLAR